MVAGENWGNVCNITKMWSDNMKKLLFLVIGDHHSGNDSGNDSQQENEKTETDPSFLASSSSRHDRLVCVLNAGRNDVNDGEMRRS